jgi:hypothetical protein
LSQAPQHVSQHISGFLVFSQKIQRQHLQTATARSPTTCA